MAAIIPAAGKVGIMTAVMTLLSNDPSTTVHLYALPITFSDATVLSDFTECVFDGYVPASSPIATDQGVDSEGIDQWLYSPVTFSATGPGGLPAVAFGYWIQWINPATGLPLLLWCEAFGSAWTWTTAGQILKFILALGGSQGTP